MAGERFSFTPSEPVPLDPQVKHAVTVSTLRKSGADPVNLDRVPPTLRVFHRRMRREVLINLADFDPEQHEVDR
jgi:hypothetical protein